MGIVFAPFLDFVIAVICFLDMAYGQRFVSG